MNTITKECNVVMLATEPNTEFKPNELLKCIKSFHHVYEEEIDEATEGGIELGISNQMDTRYFQRQYLYITSDDEIKEGDWVMFFWNGGEIGCDKPMQYSPKEGHVLNNGLKKIIATTDPKLGFYNSYVDHKGRKHTARSETKLPKIPQSFIESYVKKPVDKVEVEYVKITHKHGVDLWDVKLTNNEITIQMDKKGLTHTEALEALKKLPTSSIDAEDEHGAGDQILCDLLTHLGYTDVVEAWERLEKWYA